MDFTLQSFIWLTLWLTLSTFTESDVILNFKLYDYRNPHNIMHNGKKCESFSWMNDHCDPMFKVCLTSRYRCDVLNFFIDHWKNKKYIYNVLSRTIKIKTMPETLSIDIIVDDHDRYDSHDHIAQFYTKFYILNKNIDNRKRMDVIPSGLHLNLFTSLTFHCEDNYYGQRCDRFCVPKKLNYFCNQITGEKICSLNCGKYGWCSWDRFSQRYKCTCKYGWTGYRCQSIHYNNCSMISCKNNCVKNGIKKYCTCKYDDYIETCSELLPKPTTTVKPTTTSIPTTTIPTTTSIPKTKMTKITKTSTTQIPTTISIQTKTLKPTTTEILTTSASTFMSTKTPKSITLSIPQKRTSKKFKKTTLFQTKTTQIVPIMPVTITLLTNIFVKIKNEKQVPIITAEQKLQKKNIEIERDKDSLNQMSNLQIHNFHSPTTIIIICLLLLLCICIIALIIVIGKKKKVIYQQGFYPYSCSPRSMPSVIYKPNVKNITRASSIFSNTSLPEPPQFDYDSCTIQTDFNYETIPFKSSFKIYDEDEGIYEDPIIENADSLTCITEVNHIDIDDYHEYEEPIRP